MKTLITALLTLSSAVALANGSSHPAVTDNQPGGLIRFEDKPRVFIYGSQYNAISDQGEILICPYNAEVDWNNKCADRKTGANIWRLMTDAQIPGFKISDYEYRFVGSGYRTLVVYYEPIKAPAKPEAPTQTIKGPITIKADGITVTSSKVYIQRKK